MQTHNKTQKFKDIKQSPLKSVFPQYFYNKTPVKSPSILSKFNESENNENSTKSDKLLFKSKQISNLRNNDLANEIPSPKKSHLNTTQPKLKQLTMTQALSTQINSPKKFYSINANTSTTRTNDFVTKIKSEPNTTLKNESFRTTANNLTKTPIDPNETCLPSVFNVKNEPIDMDVTTIETNQTNLNVQNNEFDRDYFADFDK